MLVPKIIKKILNTLLCISKEASWWEDIRTDNQIGNFQIIAEFWQKTTVFWTTSLIFLIITYLALTRWISKSFNLVFRSEIYSSSRLFDIHKSLIIFFVLATFFYISLILHIQKSKFWIYFFRFLFTAPIYNFIWPRDMHICNFLYFHTA